MKSFPPTDYKNIFPYETRSKEATPNGIEMRWMRDFFSRQTANVSNPPASSQNPPKWIHSGVEKENNFQQF